MFGRIKTALAVRKERKQAINEAMALMPHMYDVIDKHPQCTLEDICRMMNVDKNNSYAMLVMYRTLMLLNENDLLLLEPPDKDGVDIVDFSRYSVRKA